MTQRPAASLSFLVFSDDWGEHPSSCQHIFSCIAKEHRVFWVNTVGMRQMRLTRKDAGKAFQKLKKMLFGASASPRGGLGRKRPANLHVAQPFMLPFVTWRAVRRFNAASVVGCVRKKMAAIGMQEPILVTTVPNAADYVGNFGERRRVYYCVDDFTSWPGLEHELVRQMEERLIAACDTFIASSQRLLEKLEKHGKPVTLITHGVDLDHFSNLPNQEHHLQASIPGPRVGYFGLIDERLDQELLATVAESLPDVSFVMTGNIVTDISLLQDRGNVYWTGPVSYEELPAVLAGWRVCILPYRVDATTAAINPLKLKEYLATGKPVVVSSLPEARKYEGFLEVAESSAEWVMKICQAIARNHLAPEARTARLRYLQGETWQAKAEKILAMVGE